MMPCRALHHLEKQPCDSCWNLLVNALETWPAPAVPTQTETTPRIVPCCFKMNTLQRWTTDEVSCVKAVAQMTDANKFDIHKTAVDGGAGTKP